MNGTSYRKYMSDGFIATFAKFKIVWEVGFWTFIGTNLNLHTIMLLHCKFNHIFIIGSQENI